MCTQKYVAEKIMLVKSCLSEMLRKKFSIYSPVYLFVLSHVFKLSAVFYSLLRFSKHVFAFNLKTRYTFKNPLKRNN